jgi:hypothetical protein
LVVAFNRRAHEMHIATISMYNTDMKDIIFATTHLDKHYLKIKETLQQGSFQ